MVQFRFSQQRSRGIYLLPNLFTTAGIFAAFFAIVAAIKGHFGASAVAIFVAMITDALDGRVARLTDTQTAFGKEYDSLSDMIAFGLAPALVIYLWALAQLGKLGWLVAFIYTACAALRLARFNTQVKNINKRFFQGIATTPTAGLIASIVWFGHTYYGTVGRFESIIAALITMTLAGLMVSNIRYRSFKDLDLKGRINFFKLSVIVLVFAAIAIDPPTVLLLIFLSYGLSGPLETLVRIRKVRQQRKQREKQKTDSG